MRNGAMVQNKQSTRPPKGPPVRTATQARGARIVKGGAMVRIVIISVTLAAVAMVLAFMFVR